MAGKAVGTAQKQETGREPGGVLAVEPEYLVYMLPHELRPGEDVKIRRSDRRLTILQDSRRRGTRNGLGKERISYD